MAKHRKTRQEKMVADSRHVTYHLETSPAQASSPVVKNTHSQSLNLELPVVKTITTSYDYVRADLRKTVLVTGAIIIAQIFLFITLSRI